MHGIQPELREFISTKFGSPDQLEVFLLLYGSAERDWSPDEVASRLGVAPQSAGMRLFLLASAGLLTSSGPPQQLRYSYAAEPALDLWSRLVAEAWERDRAAIVAILRGGQGPGPAAHFADAFKLRKP